jgi:hypothetical protein
MSGFTKLEARVLTKAAVTSPYSGNKFHDLSVFVILLIVTRNQARRTLPLMNQNSLLTILMDHKITVLRVTNF